MDRKGWIILAICGILLSLNFYFKPAPQKADPPAVDKKEQPATPDGGSTATDGNAPDATPNTPAAGSGKDGLVNEPPVDAVGENEAFVETPSTVQGPPALPVTTHTPRFVGQPARSAACSVAADAE